MSKFPVDLELYFLEKASLCTGRIISVAPSWSPNSCRRGLLQPQFLLLHDMPLLPLVLTLYLPHE